MNLGIIGKSQIAQKSASLEREREDEQELTLISGLMEQDGKRDH